MTTGELLNNSSSVTNVSAWEHLQNLDVGGSYIINDGIQIQSRKDVMITEEEPLFILEEKNNLIYQEENAKIEIKSEDNINGIY